MNMKRVRQNYYFQKYGSNGDTHEKPRGPSNTTLWIIIFQKNNTVGTWNIHLFFPNIFMLPNERVLVPFMYIHNTPFIFPILSNNTSGTRYCYCWTKEKHLVSTKTICHKNQTILHDFPMVVQFFSLNYRYSCIDI